MIMMDDDQHDSGNNGVGDNNKESDSHEVDKPNDNDASEKQILKGFTYRAASKMLFS